MYIWFLIVIPILTALSMFVFFNKKRIALWEYLLLFGSSIVVIFVSKLIIEYSMIRDVEYWSETAYEVEYEGAYDEYINKTCTEEYPCGQNSDGEIRYCTKTYDCSYITHYPPKYSIKGKNRSVSIKKSEYDRIKNKWGNEKKTGYHSNSYSYDDGIYSSFWLNRRELIECIVTEHSYENKVQATKTVLDFQKVTVDDIHKYGLFEYPEIYDNYKQNHIIGFSDDSAEKNMQILNAELGQKKELKTFIIIFKNKTKQSGIMQEAYWKGGNKNEFVLTIGIDSNNNIKWVHPFTWAEKSIVKIQARDFVLNQEKLNLNKIVEHLYDNLNKNFVRKHFSEFNYLTIEPSLKGIIISMVIVIVLNISLAVWFVLNEFDEEYFVN